VFGRGKKLRENGAQAQAVVLDSEMGSRQNSHGARNHKLTLRVQFDDGSTGEARCTIWRMLGGAPGAGEILPVRYDPDDRGKVEVDIEALDAGKLEAHEEAKAKLIQAAEEKLSRGDG
jgi:hypothetical protein